MKRLGLLVVLLSFVVFAAGCPKKKPETKPTKPPAGKKVEGEKPKPEGEKPKPEEVEKPKPPEVEKPKPPEVEKPKPPEGEKPKP